MQSFAQAAYDNDYVKPAIREDGVIEIKGGRHPVVEKTVRQDFVPNDAYLDTKENTLMIITGPNMAGKSTFMRQTGLIVIMAQIGCFVPAASACYFHCRPCVHPGRGFGRSGFRAKYLYGGDERAGQHFE